MRLFPYPLEVPSSKTNLFHLPCSLQEAPVVIIPAPWDVTGTSGSGASLGPESILKASYKLSLFAYEHTPIHEMGIFMLPIPHDWKMLSDELRHDTANYIHTAEWDMDCPAPRKDVLQKVNRHTRQFKNDVKVKALNYLNKGKLVAVLGGDHSTPLGLIEALAEKNENFGILHINAHAALRKAYQGFTYSHASIMYNALKVPQVKKLIQVGLRDYTEEEIEITQAEKGRVVNFMDRYLKNQRFQGITWKDSCQEIIATLPEKVYVSLDIDGLDAKLCPGTGTPVPGGLDFNEARYLFDALNTAGKKIIGFDLCEVAPGDNLAWDAEVGSRMLYTLAYNMARSQGKMPDTKPANSQ
ncbi:MAG: agmatinase family protein [Bacteroidota bacterium]